MTQCSVNGGEVETLMAPFYTQTHHKITTSDISAVYVEPKAAQVAVEMRENRLKVWKTSTFDQTPFFS